MDVTRILTSTIAELSKTDIADYALEALRHSNVQRVVMLGRRGSAEAAFTHPELKEFGELEEAQVIVSVEEATPNEVSVKYLTDKSKQKNVDLLKDYASRPRDPNKRKEIVMRFLVSPVEAHGTDRLEQLTLVQNELIETADGQVRPRATDRTETLELGALFSSIGYKGVALPDVPFDERGGVFPNQSGRLLTAPNGQVVVGEYVAGWIKRGPSGIIGTNKPDSVETVKLMLADAQAGQHLQAVHTAPNAIPTLLNTREVRFVSFAEWQRVDAEEVRRGQADGRPRVKFTDTTSMLALLAE
jgi:ferredoxin--NADP+ reductase